MSSIIEGYNYDIFISYRQNDNKYDGWVTEFVDNLNKELEATIKDKISIYFDINPYDGLLETDSVDKSLAGKLKCLIFIPIISRTYCDPKSYAWQHEFCAFNKLAKEDKFGRDFKLSSGNVASRILPIKIHDLDPEDKELLENELGGVLRGIEFIYKEPGVNRSLRANEDHPDNNLIKTYYRNQINKVANAVKEIITALKKQSQQPEEVSKQDFKVKPASQKNLRTKIIVGSLILLALIIVGLFIAPKLFKPSETLEKSVAVLPFVNLSNDPEQEYFSDGVVEAILNHLFKVGELKVISSTSTKRYRNTELSIKEIAKELGVASILEGSVQKIGNNVRITAQLIEAKTDVHLWSEIYDKDLSDIFLIQSEVAQNVAKELKATLTSRETDLVQNFSPTTNQLAYDYYLKGNDYWARSDAELALVMYSKAIKEDSLYTIAYAKRAVMHGFLYWTKYRSDWQDHDLLAMKDIKKALQINPELHEVKFAEAVIQYWLYRNYDKSLKILKDLKEKAPNMADLYAFTSYVLKRQNKMEESIIEAEQSIQLDPFNANYIDNLLQTYEVLHQYDNMIEKSRRGLSLIPDYKNFNSYLFFAYLKKIGDINTAFKESGLKENDKQYEAYYYTRQYDKLIEFIKKNETNTSYQSKYIPKALKLALVYHLSGHESLCKIYADSAIIHLKEKLKEIPDDDRIFSALGICYALGGNSKEAISCGEKAIDLKPIKLDAFVGPEREMELMQIYVLTRNYEKAIDKIEYLLSIPSWLSIGELLIDPIFDDLRNLARYKKIIENAPG